MDNLSSEERARILFDQVDVNNSGRLEYSEFEMLIKQLEMKISRKNLDAAIAGMRIGTAHYAENAKHHAEAVAAALA